MVVIGYLFLLVAVAFAAYERGAYKGSREAERLMMPALEKIVAEIVRLREAPPISERSAGE